jgi:hypothetical protein
MESGGRFGVDVFGRNLASLAMDLLSHLIYFIKNFYKYYTLVRLQI